MSNLFENPSNFQELNPGECCLEDKYVTNSAIAYNSDNSKYELTLTFNDGTTLVAPYPASFYSLSTTNVLTVTKSGNDTDALAAGKYDFIEPWLNPTVAMASADAGDVVIVYPGTYKIGTGGLADDGNQHMVKNGVTLYMMPGAVIHYTNATGTISLPFTDGGALSHFKIKGKGQFLFEADTSTSVDYFNFTKNASSTVDWEFDKITTNRRFGAPIAQNPNFASWRLVGREYVNSESGIFQFDLPASSTNRFIDIDIEYVRLTCTNTSKLEWVFNKISNLHTGSIANIRYGKVSYPNAKNASGFHENDACSKDSIVNLTIDNLKRTGGVLGGGEDDYTDFIVYHNTDASKGTYTIRNIETEKGLIKSDTINGSDACREAYLQGVISNNTIANQYLMHFDTTALHYKIDLNIIHSGSSEYSLGIYAKDSYLVKISGYLEWGGNAANEPLLLDYGSEIKALTVWNFILAGVSSTYSAKNLDASNAVKLTSLSSFSNKTPVNAAGGGVTELVGAMTISTDIY